MTAIPRILSKSQRIGILQQSKVTNHWTAPAAANAAFETQFYNRGESTPDPNVTIDGHNNMAGLGGVMNEYDNVNVDSVTGLKSINFAGMCTKETLAKHLIACFQKVTEAALTPFAKQFTFADSVLDWKNNDGYLHTVAFDTGISGYGVLLENALLSEYSIVIDTMAKGKDRYVKHSGTWTGNKINYTQNLSGVWVPPAANTFFNDSTNGFEDNLDITVGVSALTSIPFYRFEFKYSAKLDTDYATVGGKANNYLWSPSAQFIVDIPFTTQTEALLSQYSAGANASITSLDNGIAAHVDKDLIFSNSYGHLKSNPYKYDKEYVALRLEIEIEKPTAGWGSIIQLTDTIDGAY